MLERSLSCTSRQPAVSSQVMGSFPQLLGRRTGRAQHFWQLFHQRRRGKFLGKLEVSSERESSVWRESEESSQKLGLEAEYIRYVH